MLMLLFYGDLLKFTTFLATGLGKYPYKYITGCKKCITGIKTLKIDHEF